MNRRSFLKGFALGAAGLYVPKIIFDMGAHKHLYIEPKNLYTEPYLWINDIPVSESELYEHLKYTTIKASYTEETRTPKIFIHNPPDDLEGLYL